jgi:hypothetical protein
LPHQLELTIDDYIVEHDEGINQIERKKLIFDNSG